MDQERSVLVVDQSEETGEVLQTALSRRGVRTYTARHATEGAELGRRHCPDLVVLDLEIDGVDLEPSEGSFWANLRENNVPIILLGNCRRKGPQIPGSEFVAKPYHFGPLIRRIEEILESD